MNKAELLKANGRFIEELKAKGIVYDTSDDMSWNYRIENDMSEKFVAVCGDFLITVWYSAVLDPEYHIYNRKSWKLIATQATLPDGMLFGSGNKWWSFIQPLELTPERTEFYKEEFKAKERDGIEVLIDYIQQNFKESVEYEIEYKTPTSCGSAILGTIGKTMVIEAFSQYITRVIDLNEEVNS